MTSTSATSTPQEKKKVPLPAPPTHLLSLLPKPISQNHLKPTIRAPQARVATCTPLLKTIAPVPNPHNHGRSRSLTNPKTTPERATLMTLSPTTSFSPSAPRATVNPRILQPSANPPLPRTSTFTKPPTTARWSGSARSEARKPPYI